MALIAGSLSLTRVVGLAAYSMTLVVCATKAGRVPAASARRLYGALALAQLLLLLDIAFGWRWKLHDFFMHAAMAEGAYQGRRPPQRLALLLVAMVTLALAGWICLHLRRRPGAAVAVAATLCSIALHVVEMISYHGVDAILSRMVDGFMLVSLLWMGLALITCAGVWMDRDNRTVA